MDGRVIKLHALSDTNGTGAQHDDLLFVQNDGLVLLLIGGVEVRDITFKLGGTGVDHLVDRSNVLFPSQFKDFSGCTVP